jgi:hypothetical protein
VDPGGPVSRLRGLAVRTAAELRGAVAAAQVEVALALAVAASLSIALRSDGFEDRFARIAAGAALAFAPVFALSVLALRRVLAAAPRWAATAVVVASSFGYAHLRVGRGADAELWRWSLLVGAGVFLLLLAPAVPWRGRDRRAIGAFGARLAASGLAIGLYAAALFGLLAGAVAAVVGLFDLASPEHLYGDLAGAIFFALAPILLVGGIRRLTAPPGDAVPAAAVVLGRWLWAPALVVYLAILYAYAARVLATGELPRNLLSPLVIAAGVIGLAGAWLLASVHGDGGHRGLALLARLVPALLLPLVPLALWGLGARLGEYGWTEFRYVRVAVVVALGILAVLGTARLARRRPPLLTTVPIVFAAVLLAAAVGPWGALAVSRADQTARLRSALADAGVDPARVGVDTVLIDSAAWATIDGGVRYLFSSHGSDAVRTVLPALADSVEAPWGAPASLGFRRACGGMDERTLTASAEGEPAVVGGGSLREVRFDERGTAVGRDSIRLRGTEVLLQGPDGPATAGLGALPGSVETSSCGADGSRIPDGHFAAGESVLLLRRPDGSVRAQLVVARIQMRGGLPIHVNGVLIVP